MPTTRPFHAPLLLLPLAAALVVPLAGCGGSADTDAATSGAITVEDAWVRASDQMMTGAFATISNSGDTDLTIVSAETTASDLTELHEVVMQDGEMVMRPKADGFLVPAGGEHVLEPGADHVMIMDMTEPIEPGEDVDITLAFDDGSTVTYTAQAREAEVGDETYVPGESMDGDEG
jgi:periplasmic copper chaperone A